MKKKLRSIIVDSDRFLYLVQRSDDSIVREVASIKIFKDGYKNSPLSIDFDIVFEHASSDTGGYKAIQINPFVKGLELLNRRTGMVENVNIYTPGFVSRYIQYAKVKGWDATQKEYFDGVSILSEWGYDVSSLYYYAWDKENGLTSIKRYK